MNTTTIRISLETRSVLNELAHTTGVSMQVIIDRALELYRRQQMLTALNDAYAAIHADPDSWQELQAEHSVWDETLQDGLEKL